MVRYCLRIRFRKKDLEKGEKESVSRAHFQPFVHILSTQPNTIQYSAPPYTQQSQHTHTAVKDLLLIIKYILNQHLL